MLQLSTRKPTRFSEADLHIFQKLRSLNWGLVLTLCLISASGVALLYSAGGMAWEPWAGRHLIRLCCGMMLMIVLAMIDVQHWFRLAYPAYFACLLLLVAVEVIGQIGMGAQRWIDLGVFTLQPSELMKIALVLALARYFHQIPLDRLRAPLALIPPLLMTAAPVVLVLLQPNLGTAALLAFGSGAVMFAAGVPVWIFWTAAGGVLVAAPVGWQFLHDYQKDRVLTFLDPGSDPLGAGYNILQSTIAIGSGGVSGKGFGMGSQSQLMFLPEKHTDFIFVVLAEEMGLMGAIGLLLLFGIVLIYGYLIGIGSKSQFGRVTALGLTTTFFLYLLMNIAMVSGLIPVVGIPLPLVSYGGTAIFTFLIGCGLLLSISVHRESRVSPHEPLL
ncbi:rod shape-determining protein RodA [Rhodospirillaceae bacterium SYSU D60014]|uniref:rod shape-determining protein RodA n=1 Tax=Virgifigura deserti TaxID=2268457 RepID=UPI000E673780